MPVTSTADPSGRFAVLTLTDPYSLEEWRQGMLDTIAGRTFLKHRAVLVDRRPSAAPTTAFVDAMIEFFSAHHSQIGNGRFAIVVRDDSGFDMVRMTELKAGHDNPRMAIQPFREYDAAVRWLRKAR
jgi:hypothetical protein